MSGGLVFVDTNVLVYARDSSERTKHPRARAWLEMLWRERTGRLSTQVLHEYYVTVTRNLKPGLRADEAREDVRDPARVEACRSEHGTAGRSLARGRSFWFVVLGFTHRVCRSNNG